MSPLFWGAAGFSRILGSFYKTRFFGRLHFEAVLHRNRFFFLFFNSCFLGRKRNMGGCHLLS